MTRFFIGVFTASSLIFAGCGSLRSDQSIDPASVKLLRNSDERCKKVGDLTVISDSAKELESAVRKKAARKGATHVQITIVAAGSSPTRTRAFGVMLTCPSGVEDAEDKEMTENINDIDSDRTSSSLEDSTSNELTESSDKESDESFEEGRENESFEEDRENEGGMPYLYKPDENDSVLP